MCIRDRNNGKEYLISIHHVPSNKLTVINEVIENAYLMKATHFKSYQGNVLSTPAFAVGKDPVLVMLTWSEEKQLFVLFVTVTV